VTEEILFPTFCHIGEYDEYGYQILHRMLAVSQPLILWAPTSPLLERGQCRIPPRNFLRHVEEGRIRVFAREQWLAGYVNPVWPHLLLSFGSTSRHLEAGSSTLIWPRAGVPGVRGRCCW
jgi:hypothetical protein